MTKMNPQEGGWMQRCAAVLLLVPTLVCVTALRAGAQGPGRPDFNTDGFNDLPVGAPMEGHSGKSSAGAVTVMMGEGFNAIGVPGLTKNLAQQWTLNNSYVGQSAENGDLFGFALATGDFNADHVDDLAIGIPGRKVRTHASAGAVVVLYGAYYTGLVANPRAENRRLPSQYIVQGADGIAGVPAPGDLFGHALTSGDFNGDGFDDLAIGAPGGLPFLLGPQGTGGEVNVIYGSSSGLHPSLQAANQLWSQQQLLGTPEAGDWFGFSLASGQWGHGDQDDLAIGVPGDTVDNVKRAGAVNVLYGSPTGLTAGLNELFDASDFPENTNTYFPFPLPDAPQANAYFGFSLSGGDLDGHGVSSANHDDLAIGEPFRDVTEVLSALLQDAGTGRVLYGTYNGLSGAMEQAETLKQGDVMGDFPEQGDYFGLRSVGDK